MKPINYKSEETTIMEIEREIAKAYVEVLNRPPDPMGNEIYLNSILKGYITVPLIRADLKSSPEYKGFKTKIIKGEIGPDIAHINLKGDVVWAKKVNEEDAIKTVNKRWNKNGITFVSTWAIRCGIAGYSKYLMNAINKIWIAEEKKGGKEEKDLVSVYTINSGMQWDKINGNLIHIQHEFGIMPKIINSDSKMIITFHSVTKDILKTMAELEGRLNIVGYIVHFDEARDYILSEKKKIEMESNKNKTNDEIRREKERKIAFAEKNIDIFVVPHGSKKIVDIEKEKIRELLDFESMGIKKGEDVAFVFGFQSGNKNFGSLIDACKNVGIKIIVSGSTHECQYKASDIKNDSNVIFLDRYLDEIETDMYALSADILLFNYLSQDHFSCSGALHRVIGSGKPVVCSNTLHFLDIRDDGLDGALKFNGQLDLEQKIREGLDRRGELGEKAREYASRTSWERVAKDHLKIYSKFTDVIQLDETYSIE